MKTSEQGIKIIKEFEGLHLRSYQCSAAVWTIGFGHTAQVKAGDEITESQADQLLRHDIQQAEQTVLAQVQAPLNQNQFDALVSFVFNVGAGSFRRSTLLRRLNTHDYTGAANELLRWVYVDGVLLRGLENRRNREKNLFESEPECVG